MSKSDIPRTDAVLVTTRVDTWLREVVVGLNLCPFAEPVVRSGHLGQVISEAEDREQAVRDTLDEARRLLAPSTDVQATSLVIVPDALADFEDYLDTASDIRHTLTEAGCNGLLQLATFHPRYRFEGETLESLGHFTNRAPYPIFHLLREDAVAIAVDQHPDPSGIPARNIARLEALGSAAVRDMFTRLGVPCAPD
jgi:hypothetical protein